MTPHRFHSYGGVIDQSAAIGHAPESRDWTPDDPFFLPEFGRGVRIEAFVSVDSGEKWPTRVGARTWLMKHVHVGHDAVVGEDCELTPGVVIGGYARIGDRVHVGINACVLPFVTVGDDVVIGAGAVVTKDFTDGEILVGNPARPIVRRVDRCPVCRGGRVVAGEIGLEPCPECDGTGSTKGVE